MQQILRFRRYAKIGYKDTNGQNPVFKFHPFKAILSLRRTPSAVPIDFHSVSCNPKRLFRLRHVHLLKRAFFERYPLMAFQADRIVPVAVLIPFIIRHVRARQAHLTDKMGGLKRLQNTVHRRYGIAACPTAHQKLLVNIRCAHRSCRTTQNPKDLLSLFCFFQFFPNVTLFFHPLIFPFQYLTLAPLRFFLYTPEIVVLTKIPQAVPITYKRAVTATFSFQLRLTRYNTSSPTPEPVSNPLSMAPKLSTPSK